MFITVHEQDHMFMECVWKIRLTLRRSIILACALTHTWPPTTHKDRIIYISSDLSPNVSCILSLRGWAPSLMFGRDSHHPAECTTPTLTPAGWRHPHTVPLPALIRPCKGRCMNQPCNRPKDKFTHWGHLYLKVSLKYKRETSSAKKRWTLLEY